MLRWQVPIKLLKVLPVEQIPNVFSFSLQRLQESDTHLLLFRLICVMFPKCVSMPSSGQQTAFIQPLPAATFSKVTNFSRGCRPKIFLLRLSVENNDLSESLAKQPLQAIRTNKTFLCGPSFDFGRQSYRESLWIICIRRFCIRLSSNQIIRAGMTRKIRDCNNKSVYCK